MNRPIVLHPCPLCVPPPPRIHPQALQTYPQPHPQSSRPIAPTARELLRSPPSSQYSASSLSSCSPSAGAATIAAPKPPTRRPWFFLPLIRSAAPRPPQRKHPSRTQTQASPQAPTRPQAPNTRRPRPRHPTRAWSLRSPIPRARARTCPCPR